MNARKLLTALLVAALVGTAGYGFAQTPRGRGQGPRNYDVGTEVTLQRTVAQVETVDQGGGRGLRGLGGTHLMVKVADETLDVHLGPTAYLRERNLSVAAGDTVEITGSKVTIDGEAALLARVVRKGSDSWELRDAQGRPLWAGGARGGR
jgi:hypothetical protein